MENEAEPVYRLFTDIFSRFIIKKTVISVSDSTSGAELPMQKTNDPTNEATTSTSMKYAHIENENTEPMPAQSRVHFHEKGTIHKLRWQIFQTIFLSNSNRCLGFKCF